jgi:hypothetical protein
MYQKSDIEILISTMKKYNLDFLERMFLLTDYRKFNLLIINQTSSDKILISNIECIKVFNVYEIGLSKSRNLALNNATKKLLVFTDDDVVFQQKFENNIIKAFNSYPKHDGFRFQFLNRQFNQEISKNISI